MKQSELLRVVSDFSLAETDVVINPNDGFDLGLMTTEHRVKTDGAGRTGPVAGRIRLDNGCAAGTVVVNTKRWEDLKKPQRIRLRLDGDILTLEPSS